MCPGEDTAQRACQGAAVNRVRRPGKRLPSLAAPPGVAVSQLPRLGFPLAFRASEVNPTTVEDKEEDDKAEERSQPLVGKVVITLETAATLQRVGVFS